MELVGQRVEHQRCTLLRRERGEEWRDMFRVHCAPSDIYMYTMTGHAYMTYNMYTAP